MKVILVLAALASAGMVIVGFIGLSEGQLSTLASWAHIALGSTLIATIALFTGAAALRKMLGDSEDHRRN